MTRLFGGPAHRRATIVIALVLLVLALTLLTIGAKSPYTHSNLNPGYDPRYTRTEQILVGPPAPFAGLAPNVAKGADAATRGAQTFVTAGCATCHGLTGTSTIMSVGKVIATAAPDLVLKTVRSGGPNMPPFPSTGLTDAQVDDILAYLKSVAK